MITFLRPSSDALAVELCQQYFGTLDILYSNWFQPSVVPIFPSPLNSDHLWTEDKYIPPKSIFFVRKTRFMCMLADWIELINSWQSRSIAKLRLLRAVRKALRGGTGETCPSRRPLQKIEKTMEKKTTEKGPWLLGQNWNFLLHYWARWRPYWGRNPTSFNVKRGLQNLQKRAPLSISNSVCLWNFLSLSI